MATNDTLSATHEKLLSALEAITTGEDWKAMLATSRRFHAYSLSNILLIVSERPDATRVAGYRTWRALGRQVRRGERGIAILAPVTYRTRAKDDAPGASDQGTKDAEEKAEGAGGRVLRGFRVAYVFDISQTDGEALPELPARPLEGEAPDAVFELLKDEVETRGFHLLRADCRPANGKTHFLSRTVVVRADLRPAQAVKTLAHELAHICLHDGSEYAKGCRGRAEVEAESVAYLVCAGVGLDAGAYSFPYVARWSDGDLDLVRSTAGRVVACAGEILHGLSAAAGFEDGPHASPREELAAVTA